LLVLNVGVNIIIITYSQI